MFCVVYFNSVAEKIEKAYFSRFDDVITFLMTRLNILEIEEHYVKIYFAKEIE